MTKEKMAEFLGVSRATAFNYAKEGRPIAEFCEKYLTDSIVDEFLEFGKIEKFDAINESNEILNFFGDLFIYDEAAKAMGRFCAKFRGQRRIEGLTWDALLYFIPFSLEISEENEMQKQNIFTHIKKTVEKHGAALEKVKKGILREFVDEHKETLSANQLNSDQRHPTKLEMTIFLKEFLFPNDETKGRDDVDTYYCQKL